MKPNNYLNRVIKALRNPYKNLLTYKEYLRVRLMSRFSMSSTKLLEHKVSFSDNLGFLHSLEEIFVDEQYKFFTSKKDPYIIDCGSNIGISIVYFKQLYPLSKIVAFEPDEAIFNLLRRNIESFGLTNVDLQNSAVWTSDTILQFFPEGSLAGSLVTNTGTEKAISVKATDLKTFLKSKEIDLLKIDIEGAENEVLFHIADELKNVKLLFLEYHSVSGEDQKLDKILECIKSAGFRYYIKNAHDYLTHPFLNDKKDKLSFDLQLNIFCSRND